MKVFLDTNVWLSATIFSGLSEELVLQCAERGGLCSRLLVQLEAHEVLKRKFPKTLNACDLFDASFQAAQLMADCDEPQDDNDHRLVAAAQAAGMELFVTGDKRVLGWADKQDICGTLKIVSPRQAWTALTYAPCGFARIAEKAACHEHQCIQTHSEPTMRSEVSITFKGAPPVRIDLNEVQPMPHDVARWWLDDQFTLMGCEPLRPTGKLLTADKVLVVAQAAGLGKFAEPKFAQEFARAASAALGKAVVHVDVAALSISY